MGGRTLSPDSVANWRQGPKVTWWGGGCTLRPHFVWVIAINSKSKGHSVGGTFVVRVRTLRPDNGSFIAIYSKVLPNDLMPPAQEWFIAIYRKKCCQWHQGSPSTLCARTPHFLTTLPQSVKNEFYNIKISFYIKSNVLITFLYININIYTRII